MDSYGAQISELEDHGDVESRWHTTCHHLRCTITKYDHAATPCEMGGSGMTLPEVTCRHKHTVNKQMNKQMHSVMYPLGIVNTNIH